MSLLPKSIHRCRRYPTKFNSGRDIPRKVRKAGITSIDARTRVGRRVLTWRDGLIQDLGGPDSLSQQQLAMVEAVTLDMYRSPSGSWHNRASSISGRRAFPRWCSSARR